MAKKIYKPLNGSNHSLLHAGKLIPIDGREIPEDVLKANDDVIKGLLKHGAIVEAVEVPKKESDDDKKQALIKSVEGMNKADLISYAEKNKIEVNPEEPKALILEVVLKSIKG